MSKEDKRGLIGVIFLMVLFVAVAIFGSLSQNNVSAGDIQEEYKAIPFFDELYSTFGAGYLSLSFVNRGWIGLGSLMTLAIIGGIVIKKMPGILQLTFLPTFYIGTYQFNGQDISHGYQIMSSDIALSGFMNMLFTLIWLMLWGGLAAFVALMLFFGFGAVLKGAGNAVNNESSNRDKFKEPRGILENLDYIARENKIKSLSDRKSDLEFKRSQLRTRNTILDDLIGNNCSASELENNRKKYDRLSKEIEDIDNDLKKL